MLTQRIHKLVQFIEIKQKESQRSNVLLEERFEETRKKYSAFEKIIPSRKAMDGTLKDDLKKKLESLRNNNKELPNKNYLNDLAFFFTTQSFPSSRSNNQFIFALLKKIAGNDRYRSTLRSLLHGYIEYFDPLNRKTRRVANFLRKHQAQLSTRWQDRIVKGDLLKPKLLDILSGKTITALPKNFLTQELSLPYVFESSNVRLLSLRKACQMLNNQDVRGIKQRQFLNNICPGQKLSRSTSVYILEPLMKWFTRGDLSEIPLQEQVQNILIESFGDPRMLGGRNSWPDLYMDQDGSAKQICLDTLTGWLTKDTLRLFFKAIEKTAETIDNRNSPALKHWTERKAFWERYLDEGYINKAWVVLGKNISSQLDTTAGDRAFEGVSYGQFSIADNAVIIMQIGQSATVVEWSHNGRVWVCEKSHPNAPTMFLTTTYADRELRHPRHIDDVTGIQHDNSKQWRHKLDTALNELTGIELKSRYYPGQL